MRRVWTTCISIAAVAACVTAGLATSAAQGPQKADFDATKHFAGKTIRIIVGFSPGGGTDLQARLFADHWGKYLPGNPRVVVTNVRPNTAATNTLYRSTPDGTTLEFAASSNIIDQFTNPQAKYKVEELRVVGSHTGSASVLLAYKDLQYKTLRDAVGGETPIRVGATGPSSGYVMRLAATSEWLDVPIKFVSGLSGTSKNLLAMERGDTDAYLAGGGGTVWDSLPAIRPGWLKNGTVRAFAKMGPSDIPIGANSEVNMPEDVPYVTDLLTDPKQKELYEAFADADARYGKLITAPPGTPDHVMDVLRTSYQELLEDSAFRAKLEKLMGEPVTLNTGADIETRLDQMVKDYAEHADEYAEWLEWAKARF